VSCELQLVRPDAAESSWALARDVKGKIKQDLQDATYCEVREPDQAPIHASYDV
jgi:hypothetical protein